MIIDQTECQLRKKYAVNDHIVSFPTETSHYSRECNPNRKYLSPTLSIGRMYDLYKTKCIQDGKDPVSSDAYRRIFNNEFNLGFGSIKSDICSRCDSGNPTESHKREIPIALEEMKNDRETAFNS